MMRCLACGAQFARSGSGGGDCPACGVSAPEEDGFILYAPELTASHDAFAPDSHDHLDAAHDGSFWFRERNRLIGDLLARHFPAACSVMEAGCGGGYVLAGLAKRFPALELTGAEVYLSGLRHARRRAGRARLIQMDARRIPFVEAFDVVCAFDVLEHIAEDEVALAAMARAVKPGGGILLSVPQHPWLWSRADDLAHHKRRYRRKELAEKVRGAGLEIVFETSFVSTLLAPMALQRLVGARSEGYGGAELALPVWLDRLFGSALSLERGLIAAGARLPVGGSRFVVARRP
ncbi:class I SAM-dependent methyltransferase [soil metagenome]